MNCWHKQGDKFSEQLQAQKEAGIKRLEEKYEAKTAEFKKTMQESIQLADKQSSEKE